MNIYAITTERRLVPVLRVGARCLYDNLDVVLRHELAGGGINPVPDPHVARTVVPLLPIFGKHLKDTGLEDRLGSAQGKELLQAYIRKVLPIQACIPKVLPIRIAGRRVDNLWPPSALFFSPTHVVSPRFVSPGIAGLRVDNPWPPSVLFFVPRINSSSPFTSPRSFFVPRFFVPHSPVSPSRSFLSMSFLSPTLSHSPVSPSAVTGHLTYGKRVDNPNKIAGREHYVSMQSLCKQVLRMMMMMMVMMMMEVMMMMDDDDDDDDDDDGGDDADGICC